MACVIGGLVAASLHADPTADELVRQYRQALGGEARLAALETYRATGILEMGDSGVRVALTLSRARPGKMRFEIEAPFAQSLILVSDGERVWRRIVDVGPRLLELSGVHLERARRQLGFHPALVDYERRGDSLSYAGRGELDGRSVDQIDVLFSDGETGRYYLDAESHLLLRTDEVWVIEDQRMEISRLYDDFRTVDGVVFFGRMEERSGESVRVFTFETLEVGVDLEGVEWVPPVGPSPSVAVDGRASGGAETP